MRKGNMRREYYIYREIQSKYIRLTLLLMVLVCLIMGFTINETSLGILTQKLSNVYPAEGLKGIYSILNSTLILRLLIMVPVIIVATMYLSHCVAGPVYRMEKELREIGEGDLSRRIVLRKNDDFKKLADEINSFTNQVDSRLSAIKSHFTALQDFLKQEPNFDKWTDTLEKISKELFHFKTSS